MSGSREALLARFRATLRARVERVRELFGALGLPEASAELHTLKGEARMLGLTRLATLAHELESRIAERGFEQDWSLALDELKLALEDGASSARGEGPPDMGAAAERTLVEPILEELSSHARVLAEQCGKALCVEVRAEGVEVERALLERLSPALLHLLHNAVDHGLELPHERGDKPELGRLELGAEVRGTELVLTVEDDGRGIDFEAIRVAAVLHGADGASAFSEQELLAQLFEPGFTTRADVTWLSGRGVGLDVVRRCVQASGGQIAIETGLGRGTRFVLSVPIA